MAIPTRETERKSALLKIWMRLRFAFACLFAHHLVVLWSPRFGEGDRIGFVGLDDKLVFQSDRATIFLAEQLARKQQILDLCSEIEDAE